MSHPPFFCITRAERETTNNLLRIACKDRGIPFVEVADTCRLDQLPSGQSGLLYRVQATPRAALVEKHFLLNNHVTAFYRSPLDGFAKLDNVLEATMVHQHNGIPIPKTFYDLPSSDAVEDVINTLGGLPVVIKAIGGSHGVGVMRADSIESLRSIVDYLRSMHDEPVFMLRQFINVRRSARLIVLGDRVISSIEYHAPDGDFRSNVGIEPTVIPKKFPQSIQDIALRAVKVLGWEFGGADVLIDAEDHPFVSEVNLPCYFARCQLHEGTDIAGMMIDYLLQKSASISTTV